MNIKSPVVRMIMDTFLRDQRENIRESVETAIETIEAFDARFMALESKIDTILRHIAQTEAREDLIEVLEEIASGATPEEALSDKEIEAEIMLNGGNNG